MMVATTLHSTQRIEMEGAIEKVVQTHFSLRPCTEINLLAQSSIEDESKNYCE